MSAPEVWTVVHEPDGKAHLVTPGGKRVARMWSNYAEGLAAALNTPVGRVAFATAKAQYRDANGRPPTHASQRTPLAHTPAGRAHLERLQAETHARLSPDDSKHRPSSPDPLTTGAARVSSMTAKAARRPKALTKHEYDQLNGGDAA